jgi:hypothetical protein
MLSDNKGNIVTFPCFVSGYISLFGDTDVDAAFEFAKEFNVLIDDPDSVSINSKLSVYDIDGIYEALNKIAEYTREGRIEMYFPLGNTLLRTFEFDSEKQEWNESYILWSDADKNRKQVRNL